MSNLSKFTRIFKKFRGIANRLHLRKWEIMLLIVLILDFSFPQASLAQSAEGSDLARPTTIMLSEEQLSAADGPVATPSADNALPVAPKKEPKRVVWVTVTAYSSTPDQTDSSPCTTANGFDVCANNQENVVAANFLTFGTVVKMPDYFGDRTFTVQDRMNARYTTRVDVWFKTRQAAREFGVRKLRLEVY